MNKETSQALTGDRRKILPSLISLLILHNLTETHKFSSTLS
jgi:hypothetical protein